MKIGPFIYLLLLFSQSTIAQTKTTEAQTIRDLRKSSNLALAKKDIDGLSKFWLHDFVQVRGNGTYLAGKDTIIKVWKDTFRTKPETSFIRIPIEVIVVRLIGYLSTRWLWPFEKSLGLTF